MLTQMLGKVAKRLDQELGLRAALRGEPRPPRGGFDIAGEKLIDWGWICVNLPNGPKRALEIGCGESPILTAMLAKGYNVTGIDLNPSVADQVSGFTFIQGDFNTLELTPGFDVIVACSVVEHVGISGRYGSCEDPDGDLKAMRRVRSLLASGGMAMITIPVGTDVVHRPWHRVYGPKRLPLLLEGFRVASSRFLSKQPFGPWYETNREQALQYPINVRGFSIGEFILKID